MVLKRDNDETLNDTTLDGTWIEETARIVVDIRIAIVAAMDSAMDARIAAMMKDFFHRLHSTSIGSDP